MSPKRNRSSKNEEDKEEEDDDGQRINSNDSDRFERRMEELLFPFSRSEEAIFEMKNENKTIKESNLEMKNEIGELKSGIKRIGDAPNPTPLWELVTAWKDVFEREVLTKLNRTEQKLFSQTCRAGREAIRRAKIKLEDKFRIYELSSISQLELAWANYQWGGKGKYTDGREYTKIQETFCRRVAETNDLALLRWIREERECAWDWRTSGKATKQGNLEMLKYCVENGCEVHDGTCAVAAKFGHLECLKYLRSKNCRWDKRVCKLAHKNDHIACLTYAVHQKCPGFEAYTQHVPAESQKK
jgi:hypothetical protein